MRLLEGSSLVRTRPEPAAHAGQARTHKRSLHMQGTRRLMRRTTHTGRHGGQTEQRTRRSGRQGTRSPVWVMHKHACTCKHKRACPRTCPHSRARASMDARAPGAAPQPVCDAVLMDTALQVQRLVRLLVVGVVVGVGQRVQRRHGVHGAAELPPAPAHAGATARVTWCKVML